MGAGFNVQLKEALITVCAYAWACDIQKRSLNCGLPMA
jgi:hypothetical protein